MVIVHAVRRIFLTDGGPPRATIDLLDAMRSRGHDTRLLCSMPRDVPATWLSGMGPRITTFPTRGGSWGLATSAGKRRIRAVIEGADIVHLQVPWDPLNYQIARIARSAGVPYCMSLRGTLDTWALAQKSFKKRLYLSLFARRMLERAAFVHCTAESEARQSIRSFPRGTTRIIPNLLDLTSMIASDRYQLPELPGLGERDRVVLFLSRVFPGKGVELLIDSFTSVLARNPDAVLVIAGSGSVDYIERLRRQVRERGHESRVIFAGFVSGLAKVALYKRASAFVLVSEHENFGNVLFEASACGTPMVISPEVATWRELTDGAGARVVSREPAAVAAAINAHLEMGPAELAAFRARSQEWTATFLDRDRIIGMYETAYAGAASTKSRRGGRSHK